MQGVMAVYSALNITPIQRLHETWKLLPNKHAVILKTVGMYLPTSPSSLTLTPLFFLFIFADLLLGDLMGSSQNYKNYREHARSAVRPFIPFQLIYLSDLTFVSLLLFTFHLSFVFL